MAVKLASGSTALSLHVSMAMVAQVSAQASWRAKSAFLLLRAIHLMVRSTVLLSISIRPSPGKMQRPSQYFAI